MPDYTKEWKEKAKIDYFAPFVNLWLSCNAWYMDHYPDLSPTDRAHIDTVKTDNGPRNKIYKRFKHLIEASDREGESFRMNLEQLHFSLQQAGLISEKTGLISFEQAVCDYSNKENKTNLMRNPKTKKNGELYESFKGTAIRLDSLFVTSDIPSLFAGVFEIIYQIRNTLIHGKMNPGDNEYQVVKYGYLVLYDLMSF